MILVQRGARAGGEVERPSRIVAGLYALVSAKDERTTLVPGVDDTREEEFVGAWLGAHESSTLEHLVAGLRTRETWAAWMDTSHVLTLEDVRGDIDLTGFERSLDRDLGSLAVVCRAPRTLLRPEDERNPLSRVRRVTSRTVTDLLSRPRDWERRTLHGIEPARALSVVSVEDWDLYENRVAARLIERLLRVLGNRIERLERIRRFLAQGRDFADVSRQSHWRRERINYTWMRVACDDTTRGRVELTLSALRRMRDLILGLLGSPLYANIPRNAQVEDALRPTNVLVNDQHYCKIAMIWRGVVEEDRRGVTDPAAVMRRRLEDAARFDDYAHLLVLQALGGLGYKPADRTLPLSSRLLLKGARGELVVERASDGTTTLQTEVSSLAVVALPTRLSCEDVSNAWDALRETRAPTLFLLHGELELLDEVLTEAEPLRRALTGWSWPRVLMVSPVSLDAVERVARVINQWDVRARLDDHPPRVAWRSAAPNTLPTLIAPSKGLLALKRPLRHHEIEEHRLEISRRALAPVRRGRAGGKDRDGTSAWPVGLLQAVGALLANAEKNAWTTTCPLCRGDQVTFVERWNPVLPVAEQTFWVRCEKCEAAWGLARCGPCRCTYPALDPGLALACPPNPAQLDHVYGRDLWSEIRPRADGIENCCPSCTPAVRPLDVTAQSPTARA